MRRVEPADIQSWHSVGTHSTTDNFNYGRRNEQGLGEIGKPPDRRDRDWDNTQS